MGTGSFLAAEACWRHLTRAHQSLETRWSAVEKGVAVVVMVQQHWMLKVGIP